MNLLFIALSILISTVTNLSASNLGGPGNNYFAYEPFHHVFYDQESAQGVVKMSNGFTVTFPPTGTGATHGSCVFLDTTISVSGGIDLKETNTIFLLADLYLDNGVSLSSSGQIYGYDRAVFLGGDLTIPNNKVLHIGGRIVIDGNGHTLRLYEDAQLFVDTDATLTLRNIVVKNTKNFPGNPPVKLAASGSQLALDNVILDLVNDFFFDRGQLFIHNDVAFTGTSAFIYRSTQPSHITSDAHWNFDIDTILDFKPSSTGEPGLLAKDLLIMDGSTSQLYLNGCTLKTTLTGLRLTKGQLLFDNKVSLTSAAQLKLSGMGSFITQNYGNNVYSVNWSPDDRFLAVGGNVPTSGNEIQIYKFIGSSFSLVTSQNYGLTVFSVNWSPDGKLLAVGGYLPDSGNEIQIYRFTGSSLSLITSQNYGSNVRSVKWSPDGRFLAVVGDAPDSGDEIQVYSFSGASLSLVASQNYGTGVYTCEWSPDGRFLAVGGNTPDSGDEIEVYRFTGSSLTLAASHNYGTSALSVSWNADGRFLAVGGYQPVSGDEIQIFKFTGSSLALVASQNYGNSVTLVNWNPDGRYLTVGGNGPTSGNETQIYRFTGSSLTLVTSQNYGDYVRSADWSSDGKLLAIGGNTPDTGHEEIEVYTLQYGPETEIQALSNSIVFGNSALGQDYDLDIHLLAGAQIEVDGLVNNDNIS